MSGHELPKTIMRIILFTETAAKEAHILEPGKEPRIVGLRTAQQLLMQQVLAKKMIYCEAFEMYGKHGQTIYILEKQP